MKLYHKDPWNIAVINKDSYTNQHLSNIWKTKEIYQPNKETFTSYIISLKQIFYYA